ncbi:MAG: ATP-binding protein [Simplicispira sp.]|nr:ATP-binding protein [Simplicispira sp.]
MIPYDHPTAFLIVGILYTMLPLITWFVLARQRSQAVKLWCVGGLLVATSSILVGLQGVIADWASLALAFILFLVSNFFRIQSLRWDLGHPWPWHWIALVTLLLWLIMAGIHWEMQNPVLRAQYVSLTTIAALAYIAVLARRIGLAEQSPSAHWISWAYGLVAFAFLLRLVELTIRSDGQVDLTHLSYSSTLLSLALLISAVVGHFGYVGLALDRSMRRELSVVAERARKEENHRLGEQIAQLDRQRSLGAMSASLGHELNQPLTAILSNAQVAKRGLAKDHYDRTQLTDFLNKIIHNTQRASQIIERIRGFIRPVPTRREPIDLALAVAEVAELVADELQTHKVVLHLPPANAALLVSVDPIQLSQIILNILRNAIQALDQVVQREIHVELRRHVDLACAGERALLQIRDSGPGFAAAVLTQAGTPFFTTKMDGLGMGLTISRTIAEQYEGTLTLANATGGGALVILDLPVLPVFQMTSR